MFFIRLAFWLGLAVVLLPTDEAQQAKLYGAAVATVDRVSTFCERNADTCETGGEFWATFVKKAEFGARMVSDAVRSGMRKEEAVTPMALPPTPIKVRPEQRPFPAVQGTLTQDDVSPPWRGQQPRAGT